MAQITPDKIHVERHTCRTAVNDAADSRTVRFTERGQPIVCSESIHVLKEMKALTIVTYQAFHSAMNQLQSQEDGEAEDFVGFDLLARLRDRKSVV